jgi:hypothetical protein
MQRASAYSHLDGAMATAQEPVASLCGYEKVIIDAGIDIYKSDDMKVGIDIPSLVTWLPLLRLIVAVDPRGGIFRQTHMANASDDAFGKLPGMKGDCLAKCTHDEQKTPAEILDIIAYKFRAMLSHVRICFGSCHADNDHPLKDLFDIIKDQASAVESSTSKTLRRTERLGKRPHPFVCFRSGQSE